MERILRLSGWEAGADLRIKSLLQSLAGGLIVSCQAPEKDPFRDAASMARFAEAAVRGGAAGIRANSAADVGAVTHAVSVPVIAIQKRLQRDGKVLITPSFDDVRDLLNAGAGIVAVECTARAQRFGALDLIRRIRADLGVPVMADIATVEDAIAAEDAGAELVASTMRGYTEETEEIRRFQPEFIAALVARLKIPVLAEGRVETPQQAAAALRAGAHAVIVGTAITRPEAITARFLSALCEVRKSLNDATVVGVDLGGTNTKAGILTAAGILESESTTLTPATGRDALLKHLREVCTAKLDEARSTGNPGKAVGIATAGWVDPHSGRIAYATDNLPGWTGTHLVQDLEKALQLPVAIENDGNSVAIAERHFGAGRGVDDFVCMTLGTGVGGGCYSGGRLLRGAHGFANAIGHIPIGQMGTDHEGDPCTCGLHGCLESYTSAAALVRYAKGNYSSAEEVIRTARAGSGAARNALKEYAKYLAIGIASIVHLLDPELFILAGGIAEENDILLADLNELLPQTILAGKMRRFRLCASGLGYYGAIYGAGAVAREKLHLVRTT
jgi:N-acetylmannosamine-6-phosphate 2-epimerase / N-acetylmannosamine kinase